jgi:hypothetical protein
MKRFLAVAATLGIAAVALAGCTATSQPIVDTKGVDQQQFAQDKYECEQYADQANVAGDAAVGALGGAAGGAALGAATGGVVGLGGGAYSGVEQKREIYRNCMRNRGYSVLN